MPYRGSFRPNVDSMWYFEATQFLDQFESVVTEQCHKQLNHSIDTRKVTDKWSYWGSVFFSLTVFTTIGKLKQTLILKSNRFYSTKIYMVKEYC